MINFKILSLATVATLALGFTPAQANNLMNNEASGLVQGNIVTYDNSDFALRVGNDREILVGSISVEAGALANQSEAMVRGDITQRANSLMGADIHIGSIKAEAALQNNTWANVSGDISQDVNMSLDAGIRVGSINANYARNNDTYGYVGSDIMQRSGFASLVSLDIGSIDTDGNAFNNDARGAVGGYVFQSAGDFSSSIVSVGSVSAR